MKPIILVKPKLLNFITFGFASGITLWPFIILSKYDESVIRHERIHIRQQLEMLVILFYAWYIVEYVVRCWDSPTNAYKHLSFEQEAYKNSDNLTYLKTRKFYAWIKYLKK
jgi:hypothetical protein